MRTWISHTWAMLCWIGARIGARIAFMAGWNHAGAAASDDCYDFPFLSLPRYIPFHSDRIPLLIFMRLSSFFLSSFLFLDMTRYDSSSPRGYASPLFPHFLWLCFTMRLHLPFASLLYDSFSLLLDLPFTLLFTYKNPCSLASISLV